MEKKHQDIGENLEKKCQKLEEQIEMDKVKIEGTDKGE